MSKVVTGKITDYGKAPYKDDEKNQPSFFVEIESESGNKSKFWGVGLENALSQNKDVQKGDTVALVDKGVIDGTKKREWEIEKQEPLAHYKNSIENDDKALQKKPEQVASHNQAEFKKEALKDDAELDLPTSIKNNYVAMVRNRFFANEKINFYDKSDSSSIAFEDRKNTLHTSREDEKTIKAMVEVASSKNWQSITLKGTEEFKQKAWLEASLRGIDVKGYQPNEQDLATLKAKQEERTHNQIVVDSRSPVAEKENQSPSLSSNDSKDSKKDDEFKIDVVGSYDAAKAMAGDKIEPDSAGKRVLRDTLTFDKVDIAKLVAYNTVGMVASGGVATAVKGAVIAHEIYKGSKIASKEVGKQVDELKDRAKDGFSQDSKESVGKEKKDTSQSKADPIELRNEKKVDVINTFKNEVSPELERGVNRKTGIHGLKVILDNYKDKVSEKDLIAIEAYKNVITERYKDNPDLMNKRLDDLGAKVPDIAAGKFNLPEPPVIKQEASIDIEHSKKGDQDRGR